MSLKIKIDHLDFLHSILLILGLLLLNTGCASTGRDIASFIRGSSAQPAAQLAVVNDDQPLLYSENAQAPFDSARKYERMSAARMAQKAKLEETSGSLWSQEGQSGYLFTQNRIRREGDPLPIKLEGAPKRTLDTKVSVIKKMIDQFETRSRRLASADAQAGAQPNADGSAATPAATPATAPAAPENSVAGNGEAAASAANAPLDVEIVPTKIVERLPDGSYKVRGDQPFMIGAREFKVIVSGIVRSEDFSDTGMDASRLLDPKFDIVSVRRGK